MGGNFLTIDLDTMNVKVRMLVIISHHLHSIVSLNQLHSQISASNLLAQSLYGNYYSIDLKIDLTKVISSIALLVNLNHSTNLAGCFNP